MKKIKTIFERDWEGDKTVVNTYIDSVDGVQLENMVATEKIDGMNVRVTVRLHEVVRVEKRRNPDKIQKGKGIEEPWYVDADPYSPNDKYIFEAVANTDFSNVPDGEYSAEAFGKDIQGNPLGIENNTLYMFTLTPAELTSVPVTYNELSVYLVNQSSTVNPERKIEGIVWHGENGDMFKIKTKDFYKDNRN